MSRSTVRVAPAIPALTWENENAAGGAGNTTRPLTHSLDGSEEGLMPHSTFDHPPHTCLPRDRVVRE